MSDAQNLVRAASIAAIESAKAAALEAVGKGILNLAEGLESGLDRLRQEVSRSHDAQLEALFQRVGRNAQLSMLNSYGQLVTRQEGAASRTHYRAGQGRLAGGILKNALGRDDFFTAGPKGLVWGNIPMLDAAAAQWHRIAFGAGGRGQGDTQEFAIDINGLVTAIGFDEPRSPGFSMPSGVWIDPESGARVKAGSNPAGSDAFYPSRVGNHKYSVQGDGGGGIVVRPNLNAKQNGVAVRGRPSGLRPTRGIKGKPFFEAGLRRLAADLPVAIDDLVEGIYGSWRKAFKAGFRPPDDVLVNTKFSLRIEKVRI